MIIMATGSGIQKIEKIVIKRDLIFDESNVQEPTENQKVAYLDHDRIDEVPEELTEDVLKDHYETEEETLVQNKRKRKSPVRHKD